MTRYPVIFAKHAQQLRTTKIWSSIWAVNSSLCLNLAQKPTFSSVFFSQKDAILANHFPFWPSPWPSPQKVRFKARLMATSCGTNAMQTAVVGARLGNQWTVHRLNWSTKVVMSSVPGEGEDPARCQMITVWSRLMRLFAFVFCYLHKKNTSNWYCKQKTPYIVTSISGTKKAKYAKIGTELRFYQFD